jgi:hypothetical protein
VGGWLQRATSGHPPSGARRVIPLLLLPAVIIGHPAITTPRLRAAGGVCDAALHRSRSWSLLHGRCFATALRTSRCLAVGALLHDRGLTAIGRCLTAGSAALPCATPPLGACVVGHGLDSSLSLRTPPR